MCWGHERRRRVVSRAFCPAGNLYPSLLGSCTQGSVSTPCVGVTNGVGASSVGRSALRAIYTQAFSAHALKGAFRPRVLGSRTASARRQSGVLPCGQSIPKPSRLTKELYHSLFVCKTGNLPRFCAAGLPTETWPKTDCIRHSLKCSGLPLLTKTTCVTMNASYIVTDSVDMMHYANQHQALIQRQISTK